MTSSSTDPARLLSPLTLGAREAPNRVMFGPHVTNLGWRRQISDRHAAYYGRRAAGGCGIVVTETASVHPSDWPYERAPLAADSADGWAAVAAACHPHGALVLAGLGHTGGQGSTAYSQQPLWAPSGVPEVNTREVPKVMETADIAAVRFGFGEAAGLAVRAGLDGVELNMGQHSLLRQFASGLTNQRGDAYGEDKLRFAKEVLYVVRNTLDAVADERGVAEPVLGLRFCVDELAPWAGITPEAATGIAEQLASFVDYVAVVRGSIYSVSATRPDGHTPPGFNRAACRDLRTALHGSESTRVRVPVFLQGSVVDPAMAAEVLADGTADGVEMTRAQIADPDLVRKLADGRPERVRPCILCNQTCQVQDNRNPIVTCVGEPSAGHETTDPSVAEPPYAAGDVAAADRPGATGEVLVVGGGPGGLEAARVAARMGHRVRLVERSDRLGGAVRAGAVPPGRERLAALADWLEAECGRLGVDVVTGHAADVAEVAAHTDAARTDGGPVVVATGSREGARTYRVEGAQPLWGNKSDGASATDGASGIDGASENDAASDACAAQATGPARLVTAAALLERIATGDDPAALVDGPVVVWDPVGGPVGVGLAELLISRGPVTLLTPDQIPGQLLALSGDLAPANTRLQGAGVHIVRRVTLRRVTAEGAEVEDRFSGTRHTVPAAVVVDAGARLPDPLVPEEPTAEERAAATAWPEPELLVRAGDAVAPRTIAEAVREGRRAALNLHTTLTRQPGLRPTTAPRETTVTGGAS